MKRIPIHASRASRRTTLAVVIAALAVGACDSPTESPPGATPVTVDLSAHHVSAPVVDTLASGEPFLQCQIRFQVTAQGRTGSSASLRDGTFYWYLPTDTVSPVASTPISEAALREAFGASYVEVGTPAVSEWGIDAPAPVRARLRLRYGSASDPEAADARFTCGPPGLPYEGAPPQIESVVLSPAAEVEPGDTLTVEVTVSSPSGLWLASIEVSGATHVQRKVWGRQDEGLTRTFTFAIGSEAELDRPLTVLVNAMDVLGQHASPVVEAGGPVVDRMPPVLHVAGTLHTGAVRPLEGHFAPGDTIVLNLQATDNHRVAHIVYEFGGERSHRDSIAAVGNIYRLPLQVPAAAVGAERITILARDVAGNASEQRTSRPDSFRIYPEVIAHNQTLALPFSVSAATLHPRGELLAVLGEGKAELRLVDVNTMAAVKTVPLAAVPTGLDFSSGGDSVILAMPTQDAIAIVDFTHETARVTTIPITVAPTSAHRPEDVRAVADGQVVVAINHHTLSQHALAVLDLDAAYQQLVSPSTTADPAYQLIGSTGRRSLVAYDTDSKCLFSYDPNEQRFGQCRSAPFGYKSSSLSHDGGTLLYGARVHNREMEVLRTLWRLPYRSMNAGAVSPTGEHVYYWDERAIAKVRVADGAYLERYPVPAPMPWRASAVLPTSDGTFLITIFPYDEDSLVIRTTLP